MEYCDVSRIRWRVSRNCSRRCVAVTSVFLLCTKRGVMLRRLNFPHRGRTVAAGVSGGRMLSLDSGPIRFGLFELDPVNGELRRRGLKVRLTPQAMTLLCLLVEPPIRMRTREEIQRRLWPGNTFVDFERSLNKAVHSLREGLGDSATNPRFIETVAAQGNRFLPAFIEGSGWEGETRSVDGLEYAAALPDVSGMASGGEEELVFLGSRVASGMSE